MGLAPNAVPVRVNASGKPALDCAESVLSFNLSHSGDYVVFSFTRDRRVGVDIELHSADTDCLSLAREYFSTRENRKLAADPSELQSRFFRYWTLKEAYLKATGAGFSGNLRAIDVSEVKEGSPHQDLVTFGEIRLQVLDAPRGYSVAIAADGLPWHASVQHWDSDKKGTLS
jgi:4'-phosphopantetheinyl transferase